MTARTSGYLGWVALAAVTVGCVGPKDDGAAGDTSDTSDTSVEGPPWVYVAAGAALTCGIREGGAVECWGREDWVYQEYEDDTPETDRIDYGELDVPDRAFASLVHVRPPTSEGWDQHACGLTLDGELVCWGKEDGDGATTLEVADPVAVAVEENLTCALDGAGSVRCNRGGAEPPPGTYIVLDAGGWVGGAIDAAGDLVYWDIQGAQGTPPATVPGPFVDLGMGYESCGLRTDGSLSCFDAWGTPDPFGDAGPTGTYTAVCGGSSSSVCAIRTDGRPECWFAEPWPDTWEVTPPPDVELTQLSCGAEHWCGVTIDGDIACWGRVGSWLDVPP